MHQRGLLRVEDHADTTNHHTLNLQDVRLRSTLGEGSIQGRVSLSSQSVHHPELLHASNHNSEANYLCNLFMHSKCTATQTAWDVDPKHFKMGSGLQIEWM